MNHITPTPLADPHCADQIGTPVGTTVGTPIDDQAASLRALVRRHAGAVEVPDVGRLEHDRAPAPATPHAFTIAIASGKGGVGKTNIAMNLAVALGAAGLRVTVLDADLGTANADVIAGVRPSARLHQLLTSPTPIHFKDAGLPVARNVLLLPGASGVLGIGETDLRRLPATRPLFDEIDTYSDVLILDTMAGVSRAVISLLLHADAMLLVTTPEPTALADAYALLKCVACAAAAAPDRPDAIHPFMIVNQSQSRAEADRVYKRFDAVSSRFLGIGSTLVGSVAQDLRLQDAVRAQQLLLLRSPRSDAARDIRGIAGRLCAEVINPPDPERLSGPGAPRGSRSFLHRITRRARPQ